MNHSPDRNKNCSCNCHESYPVSFTIKQISWLAIFFIVLSFFVFIFGYFKGKSFALNSFSEQKNQELLSDHVYASVCSLEGPCESISDTNNNDDECDRSLSCPLNSEIGTEIVAPRVDDKDADCKLLVAPMGESAENTAKSKRYCAQLIGFGRSHYAHAFANRLKKVGISVHVRNRMSKNSNGKKIAWYQVVTDWYDDPEELDLLTKAIKEYERLNDICIVSR